MKKVTVLMMMLFGLLSASNSLGAILHVPTEYATIQAAVTAAVESDTVLVADGTYSGSGNRDILLGGKNLAIMSEHGPLATVLDINGAWEDFHQGIKLTGGSYVSTLIQGFSFRDAYGLMGGAIFCAAHTGPVIDNCTFISNRAAYGGGAIYCDAYSSVVITRCVFEANEATGEVAGGAIYCVQCDAVIGGSAETGNVFNQNRSNSCTGADLYCFYYMDPPNIDARYNTFSGYHLSGYYVCPAIVFNTDECTSQLTPITQDVYIDPNGDDSSDGLSWLTPFKTIRHACSLIVGSELNPITIHLAAGTYSASSNGEIFPAAPGSYITLDGINQTATILDGGGIIGLINLEAAIDATISNLTLHNGAALAGGGIHAGRSEFTVTACTFADNVAGDSGGGSIAMSESAASIFECTFSGNDSPEGAGAIHAMDCRPITLFNCLLTDNLGDGGGAITTYHTQLTMTNCTVANNEGTWGGALNTAGATTVLTNCIFWNNPSYNDIQIAQWDGCILTIDYCNIQFGQAAFYLEASDTLNYGDHNILTDPEFASGASGDFYLSHTEAGQPLTSPCINAGEGLAQDICYMDTMICLDSRTTRTDLLLDAGTVDIGFHYPITEPCLHTGDVDGNGILTPIDALHAFQIYLGLITPTYIELCAANCNGEDDVTPSDAYCIFMHYLAGSCDCVDSP